MTKEGCVMFPIEVLETWIDVTRRISEGTHFRRKDSLKLVSGAMLQEMEKIRHGVPFYRFNKKR